MKRIFILLTFVAVLIITSFARAEEGAPVEKAYPVFDGDTETWIDSDSDYIYWLPDNPVLTVLTTYIPPESVHITYDTGKSLIEITIPHSDLVTMPDSELSKITSIFAIFLIGAPAEDIGIALVKRLVPSRYYIETKKLNAR